MLCHRVCTYAVTVLQNDCVSLCTTNIDDGVVSIVAAFDCRKTPWRCTHSGRLLWPHSTIVGVHRYGKQIQLPATDACEAWTAFAYSGCRVADCEHMYDMHVKKKRRTKALAHGAKKNSNNKNRRYTNSPPSRSQSTSVRQLMVRSTDNNTTIARKSLIFYKKGEIFYDTQLPVCVV